MAPQNYGEAAGMNELTRQQYLDAMGIQVFCPRYILPAAKPSAKGVLPIEWVDAADGGEHSGSHSYKKPAISAAEETLVNRAISHARARSSGLSEQLLDTSSTDSENKHSAKESGLTLQAALQRRVAPLRFSFAIWSLENGVVFIDARAPQQALPTPTLLENIVRGLGGGNLLPRQEIIDWPLPGLSRSMPSEHKKASEMVCAFLNGRFERAPPRLVVAMGALAGQMVLSLEVPPSEYPSTHIREHFPCPVALVPSLTELLQKPLAKKMLWPLLKPYF